MGHNLAFGTWSENGFPVVGYDLDSARTKLSWMARPLESRSSASTLPAHLWRRCEKPRRILLMVPAGAPVDSASSISSLTATGRYPLWMEAIPSLDTERRNKALEAEGFNFIGTGVSGGEQGRSVGPSLMPGGQRSAWEASAPIFRAIAAKTEDASLAWSTWTTRAAIMSRWCTWH